MFANESAMRRIARSLARGVIACSWMFVVIACGDPNAQDPVKPVKIDIDEVAPAKSDDAYIKRYKLAKQRIADLDRNNKMAVKGALNQLAPDLREIAEKAEDKHLRANASLLVGSLYELAKDSRSAIAFYRQAHGLLPDEVEPVRILALALGSDGQYAEAAKLQEIVVEDDMDDLAAWLLLGELHLKAGHTEEAKKAYIRYEIRRKGLLDGLTLQKDGVFVTSAEDRRICAGALTPATDNGTAIALLYALKFEPEARVRAAILETMGIQRLAGYKKAIEERLEGEADPAVVEVGRWALNEIARDPLDTRPGPPPELLAPTEPAKDETKDETPETPTEKGDDSPPDSAPSPS
ncbi:MAG TPA: hypothetical protein ENJ18_11810 [Nannocystis exedens]|nr:hypothetical protein [Nannocystis exedens]